MYVEIFALKYLHRDLLDPILDTVTELDLRDNATICYYGAESLYYNRKSSLELLYMSISANFEKPVEDEINRKFLENLTEGFKQLWTSKQYADFTFTVGKQKFPVHKNVLGVHSTVFSAIFDNEMKEKQQSELIIEDFSADAVRKPSSPFF